jgi:hypothetical protein
VSGFVFNSTLADRATLVNRLCIAENIMTTDEIAQKHESSGAAGYPREGWFELLVAVILGLATLGSAWSGYQSGLWSGI